MKKSQLKALIREVIEEMSGPNYISEKESDENIPWGQHKDDWLPGGAGDPAHDKNNVKNNLNSKTGFTQDAVNKMTSAGFSKQTDTSFYQKGGYNNGVSIDTTQVPDTFEVEWSSEYGDEGSTEARGIESAIEKALEQL